MVAHCVSDSISGPPNGSAGFTRVCVKIRFTRRRSALSAVDCPPGEQAMGENSVVRGVERAVPALFGALHDEITKTLDRKASAHRHAVDLGPDDRGAAEPIRGGAAGAD